MHVQLVIFLARACPRLGIGTTRLNGIIKSNLILYKVKDFMINDNVD